MTFLSVIIPLYNKSATIERAVRSVLAQQHQAFELIVVDDGSSDDSVTAISAINDRRLRIIRQPNQGVAAARNRGVAESTADYVCFLDADDQWEPWFLKRIVGLIVMDPLAGLYCTRYAVVSPNGLQHVRRLSLRSDHMGPIGQFFKAYRQSRSLVNSSSACVRRNIFDNIQGFPEGAVVGEDVYVWLRISENSNVMFDATVSSIIHQDAPGRHPQRVAQYFPYYLKYYLSQQGPLDRELLKLLRHFAIRRALAARAMGSTGPALEAARFLRNHDGMGHAICSAIAATGSHSSVLGA